MLNIGNKKVLVVVGENSGVDGEIILEFAKSSNVAIYANHLSNIKNDYVVYGDLLLTCISQDIFDELYCPDILISIGGQTGDYPLYHKLAESRINYEHWRVSEMGDIVDTYDHLTKVFECSPAVFFSHITGKTYDHSYYEQWQEAVSRHKNNVDLPLSAAFVAQQMCESIPEDSLVNFSILNSLRNWNLFKFKNRVKCSCNVGAFGIDGCMSTFLGQSVMVDKLCFLFIGDLSFFYDMNSLAIRYIKNNVRIVLINNNGGVEFKFGGTPESNAKTDQYIAAAGHFKNAEGWAKTNGFEYYAVNDKDSFFNVKERLITSSNAPLLVEVFTSDHDDYMAYALICQANDNRTFTQKLSGKIKREIKKIL